MAVVAVLVVGGWSFVNPTTVRGEVRLASIGSFELGSVTTYRITVNRLLRVRDLETLFGVSGHGVTATVSGDALMYVVRLPDGGFRVFTGASTHMGQVIEWRPDFSPEPGGIRRAFFGWGSCPVWAIDGTRVFGPAPRDMDYYDWEIENDVLVLDVSEVRAGQVRTGREASRVALPSYDVLDPGWSTSGWPSR